MSSSPLRIVAGVVLGAMAGLSAVFAADVKAEFHFVALDRNEVKVFFYSDGEVAVATAGRRFSAPVEYDGFPKVRFFGSEQDITQALGGKKVEPVGVIDLPAKGGRFLLFLRDGEPAAGGEAAAAGEGLAITALDLSGTRLPKSGMIFANLTTKPLDVTLGKFEQGVAPGKHVVLQQRDMGPDGGSVVFQVSAKEGERERRFIETVTSLSSRGCKVTICIEEASGSRTTVRSRSLVIDPEAEAEAAGKP